MSCFFPSGVSAIINESPPCPGRINGFRRFKTILAAVGQQKDSVRIIQWLRGYCNPPCRMSPGLSQKSYAVTRIRSHLRSVGGGLAGHAESGRRGRRGGGGI